MKISDCNAFTIIEIMIVVSIIAVLLGVAIPNYLKSSNESTKTICINNLKQIDSAVDRWANENNVQPGIVPNEGDEEVIYGYVAGGKPKCPRSGTYTIVAVDAIPQVICSLADKEGHKLPE